MLDTRSPFEHFSLSGWAELETRLNAGRDLKTTGRRDFRINGESFLCLEQDFDMKRFHIYPIHCGSSGTLEVIFEPNLMAGKTHHEMFYTLLQRVQKP